MRFLCRIWIHAWSYGDILLYTNTQQPYQYKTCKFCGKSKVRSC